MGGTFHGGLACRGVEFAGIGKPCRTHGEHFLIQAGLDLGLCKFFFDPQKKLLRNSGRHDKTRGKADFPTVYLFRFRAFPSEEGPTVQPVFFVILLDLNTRPIHKILPANDSPLLPDPPKLTELLF